MREVAAFCEKWDMLPQGGVVLCAVSGGRDSMALLHLLCRLGGEWGFQVAAAHYNHHLRPTADRDEAFVRAWCGERGIELAVGGGDVAAFAREKGLSAEDAARQLRYGFLEDTADALGADRIATAHHMDDNAETVLLHLLRGSGLKGLGGIPPVRGRIVRPLLEVSRAEIDRYIEENSIPFVEDETNLDTVYTRNRLRHQVLPLLEELAPGAGRRIASAGALAREEEAWLESRAEKLLPPGETGISRRLLREQPEVMARRLVRMMARRLGVELTREQTEAVLALKSGGWLDLPEGMCAVCERERLRLEKKPPMPPPMALHPGKQTWGPFTVEVGSGKGEQTVRLSAAAVTGALTIARWDGTGRLAVDNGRRTIKRLFADRGIPVGEREAHPALVLGGRVIAVFGVAVDAAFRPGGDEDILAISMTSNTSIDR